MVEGARVSIIWLPDPLVIHPPPRKPTPRLCVAHLNFPFPPKNTTQPHPTPRQRRFVFKKMVECGMPKFSPHKSLHILIADCNFPDCAPYFYNKVRRLLSLVVVVMVVVVVVVFGSVWDLYSTVRRLLSSFLFWGGVFVT